MSEERVEGRGPAVDIALTVYNGERHLDAFVASLEAQSHPMWRLVVRDDGSTDSTEAKLAGVAARLGARVRVIRDADGNLGVVRGFSRVLAACDAPYVMWADADDLWLPQKIEVTLRRMRALEYARSPDTPCLVYTDLIVADPEGRPVASSFWAYERIRPERVTLASLLSRGVVTGCTVMMNRALQAIVLPIPDEAISHDWWASLLASLCGELSALDEATILYRQHGGNDLGAKRRSLGGYLRRWDQLPTMISKVRSLGTRTRRQAAAAYERARAARDTANGVLINEDDLAMVREFAETEGAGSLERKAFLWRRGIIHEDPVASVMKYLLW